RNWTHTSSPGPTCHAVAGFEKLVNHEPPPLEPESGGVVNLIEPPPEAFTVVSISGMCWPGANAPKLQPQQSCPFEVGISAFVSKAKQRPPVASAALQRAAKSASAVTAFAAGGAMDAKSNSIVTMRPGTIEPPLRCPPSTRRIVPRVLIFAKAARAQP